MTRSRAHSRALAALVLACAACETSAGGPEYVELALVVTPEGGVESPQTCLPLPMMPGARTAKDASFDPGFSVHLEADRDRAEVTFQGIVDPGSANRSVTRGALENGFEADEILVETTGGDRATVLLFGPCRPDEEPDAGP